MGGGESSALFSWEFEDKGEGLAIVRERHRNAKSDVMIAACSAFALFWCSAPTAYAEEQLRYKIDLPSSELGDALVALGHLTGQPLLFNFDQVDDIVVAGLAGSYTLNEALERLLDGTSLQAHVTEAGVLTIVTKPASTNTEKKEANVNSIRKKTLLGSVSAALIASFTPGTSTAQEEPPASDEEVKSLDQIVVLGSRRQQASSSITSPVPIDVVGTKDLEAQGNTDIIDTLTSVVPSLNANREPISDAGTLVRPVNLRALPADHTLVLVNGKRRHRGAVVGEFISGVNAGAQGVDINPLFGASLSSVEVLRDGAAAQYGSDAIAGVINYNLLADPEIRRVTLRYGSTYEGDGTTLEASGAFGTSIGDEGFATFAFEVRDQQDTSRGVQDGEGSGGGAEGLALAGYPVADPVVIWGQPNVKDDIKLMFNSAIPAGEAEAYLFATYATRDVDGSFFYRNPTGRTGVFTDSAGNVLFADTTGAGGCPVGPLAGTSFADDQAFLDSAPANCFSFQEVFPGGFTPRFGGTVTDNAITAGLRGELESGLTYDFSIGFGENDVAYRITDTLNPSLGPDSPTQFNLGAQTQSEIIANADFTYEMDIGLASPLNIAFGAQYQDEEFEITAGDREASVAGPFTDQGFATGSNGFQGFGEDVAGAFTRDSFGLYLDLEADVTDRLILSGAVRYEDFSDFGDTFNGKVAGRYAISDNFALRASYSTGFRAPTLGQSNLQRASTSFSASEGLISQLTIASTNPIAEFFGGGQLDPESSENLSVGFTASLGDFDLTVDYFEIDVEDRISQTFANLSAADQRILVDNGVPEAATISRATFFVNDFDSNTKGVDVVASYGLETDIGDTDLTLAFNYNDTTVTDRGATIGDGRAREIEDALPATRTTFTVNHRKDNVNGLIRVNHYGEAYESLFNAAGLPVVTDPLVIVDAEIAVDVRDHFTLAVGAKNIFDTFPDEYVVEGTDFTGRTPGFLGAIYPLNHPAGFNGGAYYVRLSTNFK